MRTTPRISAPQQAQSPPPAAGAQPSAGLQIDPMSIRAPHDIDMARVPEFRRDPFLYGNESREIVAAASPQISGPGPVVRSILISPSRRLAVVDGRIVGVGDTVGLYTVAEIEQSAVVFTLAGGERRRVPLHGASSAGLIR
jgi:hypothetical protein